MKNKEIIIYELMGLMKDGKAPKNIKYHDETFEWTGKNYENDNNFLSDLFYETDTIDILSLTVEILPEENEMKEMIYQKDRKVEILYNGTYKDYDFYIMNLGTHPTAYVNVWNNKLLSGKDYDEIDIDVHGGLTYGSDHLFISNEEEIKGWFIGWDYSHYNDYAGYESEMPEGLRMNGKKWTTEEIYEDVKSVIEQCINYQENDEWKDIEEIEREDLKKPGENIQFVCNILNQLLKRKVRW